MITRKHERHSLFCRARWDFFSEGTGVKRGFIANLSRSGCLLKASDPIEFRRWVRIMIRDEQTNLWFNVVGRVVRIENKLEVFSEAETTLYHYGIEFTQSGRADAYDFMHQQVASDRNHLRPVAVSAPAAHRNSSRARWAPTVVTPLRKREERPVEFAEGHPPDCA